MVEIATQQVWSVFGIDSALDEALKDGDNRVNSYIRDIVQEGEKVLSIQSQLMKDGADYIYLLTVVHTCRFKAK